MDDAGDFLSTVLPRMVDEAVGIHDGDAAARIALWSHTEPVTLFGAEMTRRGNPPTRYALRVTTLFRQEGGTWKVVHRHGDGYDGSYALPASG